VRERKRNPPYVVLPPGRNAGISLHERVENVDAKPLREGRRRGHGAHYGEAGVSRDLALRVYTTRLLGADPRLVLHGRGATPQSRRARAISWGVRSMCFASKARAPTWRTIGRRPAGGALAELRELRAREALSDEDMVRVQRANLIDPLAP